MELEHVAIITTSVVIVIGILILLPAFQQTPVAAVEHKPPRVILAFEKSAQSSEQWCTDLVTGLGNKPGILFMTGQLAEQQPSCLLSFASKEKGRDIGTYGYLEMSVVGEGKDYMAILDNIGKGKQTIQNVANDHERYITISAFRASDGVTDDNIYSLLIRNDFVADFSYSDHYNVYNANSTYWLYNPIHSYRAEQITDSDFKIMANTLDYVSIVYFSDHLDPKGVNEFIQLLDKANPDVEIISASRLAGHVLTTVEAD